MKSVIICPECKKLVYFNSYFGAYICESCGWEDNSFAKKRISYAEMQTVVNVTRCGVCTIAKDSLSNRKKQAHLWKKKSTV